MKSSSSSVALVTTILKFGFILQASNIRPNKISVFKFLSCASSIITQKYLDKALSSFNSFKSYLSVVNFIMVDSLNLLSNPVKYLKYI